MDRSYYLGYEYFKAACKGKLIEVEINGERFKYFLMSHETLRTFGRVNIRACAVSDAVPKRFHPIVAYHEYVEGKTRSHKKAVKAELEAARELGLEREHHDWITTQDGQANRF